MSKRKIKKDIPQNKIKDSSNSFCYYKLLPVIISVILIPLIVKAYSYKTKLTEFDWFPSVEWVSDIFLYAKQWTFVSICSIMVFILCMKAYFGKKRLEIPKIILPLFIYSILAILSTIFSKHSFYGVHGMLDQFENIFSLLGYVTIAYYCYIMIQTPRDLNIIINSLAVGSLALGILGTLQAFGYNFLNSSIFRFLIYGNDVDVSSLQFAFEKGRVFATLFNPNYVGVYTSMVIPLFIALLFLYAKNWKEYSLYIAVIVTLSISLYASNSTAGLVCIIVSCFLLALIFWRRIIRKSIILLPIVLGIIIIFSIQDIISIKNLMSKLKDVTTLEKNDISSNFALDTTDQGIHVTYYGNSLFIYLDENHEIVMCDDTGASIPYTIYQELEDGGSIIQSQDIRFNSLPIANYLNHDIIDICIFEGNNVWVFSKKAVLGSYTYYNQYSKFSPIKTPESALFTGYERLATGRGYIWSRTIPLLKDNIFIGSGADTFALVFPQYDYVGKYNFGYTDQIITKPHSFYLQVAIQTGIVSLLCILCFFLWFFLRSFKLLRKNPYATDSEKILLACSLSVISFLISGLTNDSSITVSPVFWTIVGCGLAAQHIIIAKGTESKKEK